MHSLRNCFIHLFEHHRGAIVDHAQWMVYHVISWVNVYISTVYDDESQLFEVFDLLSVGISIFPPMVHGFSFMKCTKWITVATGGSSMGFAAVVGSKGSQVRNSHLKRYQISREQLLGLQTYEICSPMF